MKAYRAVFLASFILSPSLIFAAQSSSVRAVSESKYTKAHSLDNDYSFDPRDGWQSINATNLQYKYRRQEELDLVDPRGDFPNLENRTKKNVHSVPHNTGGLGRVIGNVIANIWKGLKGMGKSEPVTITWYTGQDLEKPSCWADGNWAPTVSHPYVKFVDYDSCSATLGRIICLCTHYGRMEKSPQMLYSVCHTPKKCVFVRVVDTCAGCARGSKHVDLTRAAFEQLERLDVGMLTVQFRLATEPERWSNKLWGPKVTGQ